jgi:hypothetical protein
MTTATPAAGDYDAFAGQYSAFVAKREQAGPEADPYGLLPSLLELLGDVAGRQVLDAGCGEGYLARADTHRPEAYLPPGGRFPRFMLLAFSKP